MTQTKIKTLIEAAIIARQQAYAPYSNYMVGAALLTVTDQLYQGCNIECASYGGTICAERTAFDKAVSEGIREFKAIAIVGGKKDETDIFRAYAFPCGICRQVMKEFCKDDFVVIVAKTKEQYETYRLVELLPHGFGGDVL